MKYSPHVIDENVFQNPIIETGADPWMIQKGDQYYYCESDNKTSIFVRTASDPTLMAESEKVLVWKAPPGTPYSHQTWAPELYCLDNRWYIYFAASNGRNSSHRLYVLEADEPTGPYRFKGQISPETDRWAIDGTIVEHGNERYFVWSGWDGKTNIQQNLYIAKMENPWSLVSSGVELTTRKIRKTPKSDASSSVLFTLEVLADHDGPYILELAYSSLGHSMCQLEINGETNVGMHFVTTGPKNTQTHAETILLKKGANRLVFAKGIGEVEIKGTKVKTGLSDRRLLAVPEHSWEKLGGPCYVVEGPSAIVRNGKLHIIYSASGSWTDDYQLGRLTFLGGNILDSKNWKKNGPVFRKTESIFAPGHASFIQFNNQDWIVYHTAKHSGAAWNREVRMQPFSWSDSDDPVFGAPVEGPIAKENVVTSDEFDQIGA